MTNQDSRETYSSNQVLGSDPRLAEAMHLVMLNANQSGASDDRMFLRVSRGRLAWKNLLFDCPSGLWVEKVGASC